MSYKVRAEHLPTLAARIEKIAKRARKLNLPEPSFEILAQYDEEIPASDGIGFPQVVKFVEVEVAGESPKVNGWEFIATLEHDEGDVLVRAIPGVEVPEKYRQANPDDCDHCHMARKRSNTYILRRLVGADATVS